MDCICTTPATTKSGRKVAKTARFNTALLVENWEDHLKFGGLEGMYFLVSRHLLLTNPTFQAFMLLRYGSFFTCLTILDPSHICWHMLSGLLPWFNLITSPACISLQSTCSHHWNAAVVSVTDIVHSCHLMGKSSLKINPTWTMDNVLDLASHFYFNLYINVDTFMTYYF